MSTHDMDQKPEPDRKPRILDETAFQRFSIGSNSLKTMAQFLEARRQMEAQVSVLMSDFVDGWKKTLHKTVDIEYGTMRHLWQQIIAENLETAHIHDRVKNELGRYDGPLENLRSYMRAPIHQKAEEILEYYKDTQDRHKIILESISTAKRIYHERMRRLEGAKEEMERKKYRSKSSKKYRELDCRILRLQGDVERGRFQYLERLNQEKEERPLYLKSMKKAKRSFDRLEKDRLTHVRDIFLETVKISELQEDRGSRETCTNELRRNLENLKLEQEILKYDKVFLKDYDIPAFQEYVPHQYDEGEEEEEVGEQRSDGEQEPEIIVETAVESLTTTDQLPNRTLLPPLQQQSIPVVQDIQDDQLWWAHIRPTRRTIDPLTAPPPTTLRDVATSFVEKKLKHVNKSPEPSSSEDEHVPFYAPGGTSNMTNVRVKVIREYGGRGPKDLPKLRIGQTIKQKTVANEHGMAYGWRRSKLTGRKKYGMFPVECTELKPKSKFSDNIFAITRRN
ncbi:protein kinase C and casein kinase substrate in neurons protein 1-like [Haliotis cracherodii]|uniref:protein kinase C and casein kinase substrate in neurons protein 1-like n=1 Tax=Haliotis cracherodii TaxID=6455 RepID=UPI0039ED5FC0